MGVREDVLADLEANRGQYRSGEALASTLGVSRSAVWKAVGSLQTQGHQIEAVPKRGYRLTPDSNVISPQSLRRYLRFPQLQPEVYPELDSTSTLLKKRAQEGAPEGTVIFAERQTQGRGRREHSFFSPGGGGIYMSLLLRPSFSAMESLCLTTCAAVAVAKTIEQYAKVPASIKWVNDVFCHGKKVCGISTEAAVDVESGGLLYAILGIGINVFPGETTFPQELSQVATTVFPSAPAQGDLRSAMAADVLNYIMEEYPHLTEKRFFDDYRSRSFLLGQEITVLRGGQALPATALDIDHHFQLLVAYSDGELEALSSGEVSIRPTYASSTKKG